MSELRSGERQVAPTLNGIRRDHRARYEWAARRLGAKRRVVDLACGVGYGAFILARAGHEVLALDRSAEAIAYARRYYGHPRIRYEIRDAAAPRLKSGGFDAAVCFETIEHLADPLPMLQALRRAAPMLLASVPNETEFPYRNPLTGAVIRHHHRHYTQAGFTALLESAGFDVATWHGQASATAPVAAGAAGRTLVVAARRAKRRRLPAVAPTPSAPDHVCILGLGPSLAAYIDLTKRIGGRRRFCDEVWAINALGDVVQADRVFHMDDVALQERRAAAAPDGNIAPMLDWLRTHPGPIYTSTVRPGYPGLVEYPLQAVIETVDEDYFNNTAAYAVGFAIHLGVKRLSLFGVDFTYPNQHSAERGRGCVEFLLGIATARGMKLWVPAESSLLDACAPEGRLYGYDAWSVTAEKIAGRCVLSKTPKPLPSAEEIEARYDHGRPANPILRATTE